MQSVRILVVTTTRGFGQLIQQTLEESSRYAVTLVESVSEATISLERGRYAISILDAAVKGGTLDYLAQSLRAVQPGLKLIIIPPDNDLTSPIVASIAPDGYLTKPFYLPDLFDTIEEVLSNHQIPAISSSDSMEHKASTREENLSAGLQSLEWLDDINLAAQHLIRLTLESAAQAALIVRNHQIWAYAGQLSEKAAEELASMVNDFWITEDGETGNSGDKVRFARFDSTAAEYLLYVTALGDGMVLALAFDTETPFSKIRAQAGKLARALASPPNSSIDLPTKDLTASLQVNPDSTTFSTVDEQPLVGNLPSPDPQTAFDVRTSWGENVIGKTKTPKVINPLITVPQTKSLSDTAQNSREQISKHLFNQRREQPLKVEDLRLVTPAMHYLNFACLLVPRIPDHHLIGELATTLAKWLGQLCLAFGWRLEHQSIRPGYLLWIANVSPSTSPNFHIRVIRRQTSQRIFTAFPHFKKENPSGDFWAPGYLIVSSSQPPAADIINQYINSTRHHQGA
jgi:DNA-binding response OmpR family regulator/REP element-mobilizing transposase RayT